MTYGPGLVGALLVVLAGALYIMQMKKRGDVVLVSAHEVH